MCLQNQPEKCTIKAQIDIHSFLESKLVLLGNRHGIIHLIQCKILSAKQVRYHGSSSQNQYIYIDMILKASKRYLQFIKNVLKINVQFIRSPRTKKNIENSETNKTCDVLVSIMKNQKHDFPY